MKVEIRRRALWIIPENEQDKAFIEDTLGMTGAGETLRVKRINSVSRLYCSKTDSFILKLEKDEI